MMTTQCGCFRALFFIGIVLAGCFCPCNLNPKDLKGKHTLMPVPKEIFFSQGKWRIPHDFRIDMRGHRDLRLEQVAIRFLNRLKAETGIPLNVQGLDKHRKADFVIHCAMPGTPIQSVKDDESYTLQVTSTQAKLKSQTPLGVLRGLETVLQLLSCDKEGFYMPAVQIIDEPRFVWRGLLIDVCRHWLPVDVIKRNLDGMAAVKMNVLHWHLTEDQGFRVESRTYPKLHQRGSDGQFYTQDQIREVVQYAHERGIRVVPEFDMPAHSTSWFVGYPELASAPGPYEIARHWGVHDPCMDPTREETYAFVEAFLAEMKDLFPDDYVHIGGDEVSGVHWDSNPRIVAFKKNRSMKDNHDLQAYFNRRVQQILCKFGKTMIGWDEILHPLLPENIVIQSWRGFNFLAQSVRSGYCGILSHGYYLDLFLPAERHYAVDPSSGLGVLKAEQKEKILGGEACLWAELIDQEIVDTRIWPRLAAIAERFWSPPHVKDGEDMYRRLEVLDRKLERLGLTHRTNPEKMLARLAGTDAIADLKVLGDIVEPVKYYSRHRTREYFQTTPLNRLVDAVRPESTKARLFRRMVDDILENSLVSEHKETCRAWLGEWRDSQVRLKKLLGSSSLLQEIIPLSETVQSLAEAGLEALDYIERGEAAPKKWVNRVSALCHQPRRPGHELLIAIIPGIRKLVAAASD